jgi:hypothetical protein
VEELELAGEWYSEWLRRQEEDGGKVFIWMPTISLGWCYEPRLKGYHLRLKDGGNYCRIEPLGAPLLSWLVIPTGTKGGPATTAISSHVDERPLVPTPELNRD